MPATTPIRTPIRTLLDLRHFVQSVLCEFNHLEPGAFQMTEKLLISNNNPCGMLFCLHGPSSVTLTAVWEAERNTILFYGCSGQRQHRVELDECLQGILAQAA